MNPEPRTEEALREAWAADAEPAGDDENCPTAERLLDSVRGTLTRGGNDRVLLHVGECGGCAAAWRLARELVADETAAAPASARTPRSWTAWLAAAAILIIAVTLGVRYLGPQRGIEPAFRMQEGSWLMPAGEDGESLPRDRFLLRWNAGPEGSTYDVRVTTEDLELLAQGRRLERAEFLVPADALQELPSGTRIFWQVNAHLPGGRRIDSDSFLAVVE